MDYSTHTHHHNASDTLNQARAIAALLAKELTGDPAQPAINALIALLGAPTTDALDQARSIAYLTYKDLASDPLEPTARALIDLIDAAQADLINGMGG